MDDCPESRIAAAHMQSFGYVLARLHAQLRVRMTHTLEGTGLNGGHVVLLASLWVRLQQAREAQEDPGLTQTQLVQVSGVEKSSLVLFLDGLEKDNWVERRRHPADRRAHLVYLTPSGAERFAKVGLRLFEAEQENFSVFTAPEKTQLIGLMGRLLTHVETLNEN